MTKKQESAWAEEAADVLNDVVNLSAEKRAEIIVKGLRNADRFNKTIALGAIESIYLTIIENFRAENKIL